MLPQNDVDLVRRWAEEQTPPEFRDRMRVDVEEHPRGLTILECSLRPDMNGEMAWLRVPNARLSYSSGTGLWTLYFNGSNDKAQRYPDFPPSPAIRDLLDEIDDDPTCIFWG